MRRLPALLFVISLGCGPDPEPEAPPVLIIDLDMSQDLPDEGTTPDVAPDPARCGDGVVDPGERCDGDCPQTCDDGDSCTNERLEGSAEACDARCVYEDACLSSTCGNDTLEPGERCEGAACPSAGSCDDGDVCTVDSLRGSAARCDARCVNAPIAACVGGDGCCPRGCTSVLDSDCANPPAAIGDPCELTHECLSSPAGEELCVTWSGYGEPGGRCTQVCAQDSECPGGSICAGSTCRQPCNAPEQCTRAGYVCINFSGRGACSFYRGNPASSPPGGRCDEDAECRSGPTPPDPDVRHLSDPV